MGRSDDSASTQLRQTETAIGLPKELEMRKTGVVLTPIRTFRRHNSIIMAPDNRQSKSKAKERKAEKRKPKTKPKKKRSSATTSFKSKTREAIAQGVGSFCATSKDFLRKRCGATAQWGDGVVRSSLRAITFAPKLRCAPF
jgi:hypothetical protein